MEVTLACDIMLDLEGSIRPAMYLAQELVRKGYNVSMISPIMSNYVEDSLNSQGIAPINLRAKLLTKKMGLSLLWLESWVREALLSLNSRRAEKGSHPIINFSQVLSLPSLIWYLQGPPSVALRDMEKEFPPGLKILYNLIKPLVEYFDEKLVKNMSGESKFIIANSKFCASMYTNFGVEVNDIIYPPLDCQTFHPSTSNPSSNYVLTYLGKETKFSVVKRIADRGVKIKAFGSKTPFVQREFSEHPNIHLLGHITTQELLRAYSNALFTLFPFSHEPFGYVPLESMACGTPVLTCNVQGPSEFVLDERTGWLVYTDEEITQMAVKLWKEEYPAQMRSNCVKTASRFDVRVYINKWLKILSHILK